MKPSQNFVYVRSYSRWLDDVKQRETWEQTVDRFILFIQQERGSKIPPKVIRKIRQYILSMDVMPSMRAMWTAGNAAKIDNVCMYNCAFAAIDSIVAFSECLYILMCGTGFGFSVEEKYISKLGTIPQIVDGSGVHVVEDSKEGWADSVKILFENLYSGKDVQFDYSKIRKKGERLKTMGGRASGPEPLITLHNFIRDVMSKAQGRKLTSDECHDILCQIAEIVVSGGVRRSSLISLSDLMDQKMRDAKIGAFPLRRRMANNSAIYYKKPKAVDFLNEWSALANSGSGERGIFNLESVMKNAPKRRDGSLIAGTNPCGEINLRSFQFCNLSEIVIKSTDDLDSLLEKVECATWIGVIQSTFTKFPYLRKQWRKNCEEERLLGVSLTGQMDNPALMTPDNLKALKNKALKIAKKASEIMGINMPAAITTGKPSGTVSQLVNSASGCHVRFGPWYIRRYRISSTDKLLSMLRDQKIPVVPEVGQRPHEMKNWSEEKVNTWVLEFPIASPPGSITRHDVTAIQQLEHYKMIQKYWCEHNQSCTIYVKDEEWFEVGNWVYKNWENINGVSFLPYDGGVYELAPYEEITKEKYEELIAKFPSIDYTQLSKFESEDETEGAKSYSCTGDKCELS